MNRDQIVTGSHALEKRDMAVQMRHEMTAQEAVLWTRLRAGRLRGLHFRRQQIIDGYIADFYCHGSAVVVEVDGPIHLRQTDHDKERDEILRSRGLTIVRFTNEQIDSDLTGVLGEILKAAGI